MPKITIVTLNGEDCGDRDGDALKIPCKEGSPPYVDLSPSSSLDSLLLFPLLPFRSVVFLKIKCMQNSYISQLVQNLENLRPPRRPERPKTLRYVLTSPQSDTG